MDLRIKDRLIIPAMLPATNSFMDFNLKKSIVNKVAVTDSDKEFYKIEEHEDGRIQWDIQKDMETPLVVDFSKEELAYLTKTCETIAEESRPDDVWSVVEHIYNEANK